MLGGTGSTLLVTAVGIRASAVVTWKKNNSCKQVRKLLHRILNIALRIKWLASTVG